MYRRHDFLTKLRLQPVLLWYKIPKNPTKNSTINHRKSPSKPKSLKNYIPYEFQPLEFHWSTFIISRQQRVQTPASIWQENHFFTRGQHTLYSKQSSSRSTASSARGARVARLRARAFWRARVKPNKWTQAWAERAFKPTQERRTSARAQQTNTTSLLWGVLE